MRNPYLRGWLALVALLTAGQSFGQTPAGPLSTGSATSVPAAKNRSAYEQFVLKSRRLPGPRTICYASGINEFKRLVPALRANAGARRQRTATFIVDYNGFSTEAQRAFQYAVDIWSNLISSPVPIRVQANWSARQPGVLGSAGPGTIEVGSDGTQKARGIYPIALAEKIARRPLNDPADPDIVADFNRNNTWYYGTDANPPAGQTDLVSVVLHELGHGLGFIGYINTSGNTASYPLPAVFDHFLENNQGVNLLNQQRFPNGSTQLFSQLTNNNLFFDGPILQQRTGQRAKLFAPSAFDRGSSVYHLDETTYPAGTINSLMTPQIGNAEAIHTPGPLVLNMFADMEWKTTSVLHDPLEDTETVGNLTFRTRVISDTTLVPNSVRLFYRTGAPTGPGGGYTQVTPARVGTTNEYTFTLPNAQGDYYYYFQAADLSGRTFTNPGKNIDSSQVAYRVQIGPDVIPPTIRHVPPTNFLLTTAADSLQIIATVTDDRNLINAARTKVGVDTVFVEYQINGVAQPPVPLRYTIFTDGNATFDSVYVNRILFPVNLLRAGDRIQYRIVARDVSRNRNQAISPINGFYELNVVAPQATIRNDYTNTFQNATGSAADFAGRGFSIITPPGFSDPAIHSEHPYRNGADFRFEDNFSYTLLAPIRIKANPDSAVMRFDEIVLVEPGATGSRFGDFDFFDYVIVEGSRDNGRTWLPLIDGYDARANADWLTAYNANLIQGDEPLDQNSGTLGTPRLFKRREIRLLDNGNFQPGNVVLLRFRLFVDQFARGWGWAIDNLSVQVPPPPPILSVEPVNTRFSVYPNPASGLLTVEATLTGNATDAGLTLTSATGQTVRQVSVQANGQAINQKIDVSQLPTGMYFLRLKSGNDVRTKKVMVVQ